MRVIDRIERPARRVRRDERKSAETRMRISHSRGPAPDRRRRHEVPNIELSSRSPNAECLPLRRLTLRDAIRCGPANSVGREAGDLSGDPRAHPPPPGDPVYVGIGARWRNYRANNQKRPRNTAVNTE